MHLARTPSDVLPLHRINNNASRYLGAQDRFNETARVILLDVPLFSHLADAHSPTVVSERHIRMHYNIILVPIYESYRMQSLLNSEPCPARLSKVFSNLRPPRSLLHHPFIPILSSPTPISSHHHLVKRHHSSSERPPFLPPCLHLPFVHQPTPRPLVPSRHPALPRYLCDCLH